MKVHFPFANAPGADLTDLKRQEKPEKKAFLRSPPKHLLHVYGIKTPCPQLIHHFCPITTFASAHHAVFRSVYAGH